MGIAHLVLCGAHVRSKLPHPSVRPAARPLGSVTPADDKVVPGELSGSGRKRH